MSRIYAFQGHVESFLLMYEVVLKVKLCYSQFFPLWVSKTCFPRTVYLPVNTVVKTGYHPKPSKSRTDPHKYLSVMLDKKLNWEAHIKHVVLTKTIGSFKIMIIMIIIMMMIHPRKKEQSYYAYVYSEIQYDIEVYGHAKDNDTSQKKRSNRTMLMFIRKSSMTWKFMAMQNCRTWKKTKKQNETN